VREHSFEPCGDYDAEAGTWFAVRRGNLNLMVTHDRRWYEDYLLAMEVCKVLRLEHKDDRIAVCRVVRDKLRLTSCAPLPMECSHESHLPRLRGRVVPPVAG
jgi:hypothetical protein